MNDYEPLSFNDEAMILITLWTARGKLRGLKWMPLLMAFIN